MITRAKSPPFGVGVKLTSSIANAMDENATHALDKRSGETDTLGSVVTCTGAGRIVASVATGANADTTYALSGGNSIIRLTSALTANRAYTLSNTAAGIGDMVTVFAESSSGYTVTVKDAAATTLITVGALEAAEAKWATFLFNGTAWVLYQAGLRTYPSATTFSASGNYTVPLGTRFLLIDACGAGGGGGAGYKHGAVSSLYACGSGGAGGAALRHLEWVQVTPGEVVSVAIGAGGAGGVVSVGSQIDGSDGGDTVVTPASGAITFSGAQGGRGGMINSATGTYLLLFPGGAPVRGATRATSNKMTASSPSNPFPVGPAYGGWGEAYAFASAGAGGMNPRGAFAAGAQGTTGSDSGSYYGGGPGGGGGAGPFGVGGTGGNGGNGSNGGAGGNATAGTAAGANTGAGGGGGGGAGMGSASNGNAGNGAAGGSGRVVILPLRT